MSGEARKGHLGGDALRRGALAALLAWLLPGAGHFYMGARRRAVVFCALVLATLGLGLACDGNLGVINTERAPWLTLAQVAADLSLGPIDPMTRTLIYGRPVYRDDDIGPRTPPAKVAALETRRERSFRRFSSYGSTYLLAASLMNLLLILDAWDIGIGRRR